MIDVATRPLRGPVSLAQLRIRVAHLAQRATGNRWALLRATNSTQPFTVWLNTAIKRMNHLLLEMHVTVAIALHTSAERGSLSHEEWALLDVIEDDL